MTQNLTIGAAYDHLNQSEQACVDMFVKHLSKYAEREDMALNVALRAMPVTADMDEQTGGLLARPLVRVAIHEQVLQAEYRKRVSVERLINELAVIAFSNIFELIEVDALTGRPSYDLREAAKNDIGRAIKKIEHSVTKMGAEQFKVETYDKLKALDMLCRIQGLFQEDNPQLDELREASRQINHIIAQNENAAEAYAKQLQHG